jgi:hypothetical protein
MYPPGWTLELCEKALLPSRGIMPTAVSSNECRSIVPCVKTSLASGAIALQNGPVKRWLPSPKGALPLMSEEKDKPRGRESLPSTAGVPEVAASLTW